MIEKLGALQPVRKISAFIVGVWDTFLRDNKVVPPVLAVAALFVFAWIVFGSFIGTPEEEPVASQDEIAQSEGGDDAQPAPEIENPNTDSYAAYQSKDPFRQLFQTSESTTQETTTPDDTGIGDGSENTTGDPGGGGDGSGSNLGGSDDGTSSGNPPTGNSGAADDQYENGRTPPREDFTDDTNDTDTDDADTGTQTPQRQNPNRPAAGDDLFDSGGDLEAPNRR